MTINIKNFLKDKSKLSKMGEFQSLKQINGFKKFDTMPYTLATLPADCKVVEMDDKGIGYTWLNNYNFVTNQDVHVLDKESINV